MKFPADDTRGGGTVPKLEKSGASGPGAAGWGAAAGVVAPKALKSIWLKSMSGVDSDWAGEAGFAGAGAGGVERLSASTTSEYHRNVSILDAFLVQILEVRPECFQCVLDIFPVFIQPVPEGDPTPANGWEYPS